MRKPATLNRKSSSAKENDPITVRKKQARPARKIIFWHGGGRDFLGERKGCSTLSLSSSSIEGSYGANGAGDEKVWDAKEADLPGRERLRRMNREALPSGENAWR